MKLVVRADNLTCKLCIDSKHTLRLLWAMIKEATSRASSCFAEVDPDGVLEVCAQPGESRLQ